MQENYNRRHVVQGAEFAKGEKVWLPDMNSTGRVIRHHETPMSLVIPSKKKQKNGPEGPKDKFPCGQRQNAFW